MSYYGGKTPESEAWIRGYVAGISAGQCGLRTDRNPYDPEWDYWRWDEARRKDAEAFWLNPEKAIADMWARHRDPLR